MSPKLQHRILRITRDLRDCCQAQNKHFTFLLDKNRIVSVGWNSLKTHPRAKKLGYRFDATHSELACLVRYKGEIEDLKWLTICNTRINSLNQIGFSKPCPQCLPWILLMNFKSIWYTDFHGRFCSLTA